MNEREQEIDVELASMRPKKPSEDLALRIAESVAATHRRPFSSRLPEQSWRIGILCATATAVLLAISYGLLTRTVDQPNYRSSVPVVVNAVKDDTISPAEPSRYSSRGLPTRGSFHVALRNSMTDFDALLDHHGSRPMPSVRSVSIRQLLEANSS